MGTYVERMLEEADELVRRTCKLKAFMETDIFNQLPATDQSLLCVQLHIMQSYQEVLGIRIVRAQSTPN